MFWYILIDMKKLNQNIHNKLHPKFLFHFNFTNELLNYFIIIMLTTTIL